MIGVLAMVALGISAIIATFGITRANIPVLIIGLTLIGMTMAAIGIIGSYQRDRFRNLCDPETQIVIKQNADNYCVTATKINNR